MLHLFLDNRPWFRARRHGYGTGMPMVWKGWTLMLAHIAMIAGLALILRDRPVLVTIVAALAALAPMPLYRAKTERIED